MQLEIDHLQRKLCRKQQKRTPLSSEFQFDDDNSYRPRSRTPPASLSLIMKIAIISEGAEARSIGAWGMML